MPQVLRKLGRWAWIYLKWNFYVAGFLIFCDLVVGCPVLVRRAADGQVVDAQSRQPLENVDVLVETWQVSTPGLGLWRQVKTYNTRTDAQGRWSVPGDRDFWFVLPFPDCGPAFVDRYVFSKPGYTELRAGHWGQDDHQRQDDRWIDFWDPKAPAVVQLQPAR